MEVSNLEKENSSSQSVSQAASVFSLVKEFRFTTVGQNPVFAVKDSIVFEEPSIDARAVGILSEDNLAYSLKDVDDNWIYAESGQVRGFVLKSELLMGDAAKEKKTQAEQERLSVSLPTPQEISVIISEILPVASLLKTGSQFIQKSASPQTLTSSVNENISAEALKLLKMKQQLDRQTHLHMRRHLLHLLIIKR